MKMSKILLIDGNSILNRAFYGIMSTKMLMTKDGTYTNAIYGFLAIMFKVMDEISPDYLMVTFDLKTETERHKLYKQYKATRKGMPNELASQMPILKEILRDMNITIIEKEGFEADDVLGTVARMAEKDGLDVIILSGDRDTFQLATDKTTIHIPHTKAGKTEVDNYDRKRIIEEYGIEPELLIEVKGLQGDTADNIPGVPGVGEKTALTLIREYKTIDKLYESVEQNNDNLKGKLRDKIVENKDLAYLSRKLGTINTKVPIQEKIEDFKIKPWNEDKVLEKFKELNFSRYIDRFNLKESKEEKKIEDLFELEIINENEINDIIKQIENDKILIYYIETEEDNNSNKIIKKKIISISIYNDKKVKYIKIKEDNFIKYFKKIFEDENIKKYGHKLCQDYVLLRQIGIDTKGYAYDTEVASYDISPTNVKHEIEQLANQYLGLYYSDYIKEEVKERQINLFEEKADDNVEIKTCALQVYVINELIDKMKQELCKIEEMELFNNIEIPMIEILGKMQYNGIKIDKEELNDFGKDVKKKIDKLAKQIYELCGEEFNINSTQQLGNILFEKLKLTVYKKNKKRIFYRC